MKKIQSKVKAQVIFRNIYVFKISDKLSHEVKFLNLLFL
jgi:hypothetical protein